MLRVGAEAVVEGGDGGDVGVLKEGGEGGEEGLGGTEGFAEGAAVDVAGGVGLVRLGVLGGEGWVHERVGWGEGRVGWGVDVEGVEGGFGGVGD